MRIRLCIAVIVLNFIGSASGETNNNSGIKKMDFAGWKECYKLDNSEAEVIVVPVIGRAVVFRTNSGPNVFKLYEKTAGQVRSEHEKYIQYGGLYTWLAPQAHWSMSKQQKEAKLTFCPPFDEIEHIVIEFNKDSRSVTIKRQDLETYKLSVEKTYSLASTGASLEYRVKVTNHANAPVRWSIWNTAAVTPAGKLIVLAPNGMNDFQFLMRPETAAPIFKKNINFTDTWAILDLDKMQTDGQKCYVKPQGSVLIQATPEYWLVRKFTSPQSIDLFTDNHSQIEFWIDTHSGLIETEVLSPDIMLQPEESYCWTESFTILKTCTSQINSKKIDEVLLSVK
jgi:hypothetical protein